MGLKKVKELREEELGTLIYQITSGCSLNTAKQIYRHGNFITPEKDRCEALAEIIFNNKKVQI